MIQSRVLIVLAIVLVGGCRVVGSPAAGPTQPPTGETQPPTGETQPPTGAAATEAPGCAAPDIGEVAVRPPSTGQFGLPLYPPILASGTRGGLADAESIGARMPSDVPVGRQLQLILIDLGEPADTAMIRAFFGPRPITDQDTITSFLGVGGIQFVQRPGAGYTYSAVRAVIGIYANLVKVGPFDAALVVADPLDRSRPDARHFEIHWSDGGSDFSLIGLTETPEELLAMARSVHCS